MADTRFKPKAPEDEEKRLLAQRDDATRRLEEIEKAKREAASAARVGQLTKEIAALEAQDQEHISEAIRLSKHMKATDEAWTLEKKQLKHQIASNQNRSLAIGDALKRLKGELDALSS